MRAPSRPHSSVPPAPHVAFGLRPASREQSFAKGRHPLRLQVSAPAPKHAGTSLVMTEQEVDLESSVHARVGSVVVGKYRLDRVLGIGGMAAVYAATHRNQAEFAVKMLHSELSQSEDVRSRFLREGYIANSVKHPGAVRVVDDDVAEDGSAFLVMELLHGLSVEDLWFRAERKMPLRAVLAMADQLLDVLAAAHAKTIVHRDIKPANLFVTTAGDLKVLDFGIARLRDAAGALHATTQSGTMLGTPAFMSPEQALGRSKEIDGQTDVWAVGATLFSLLSGRIVHEAETAPQLLLRAASSHARPLASVAPDIPGSVCALVDRALAFDRGSRWQGAVAMRDALREAYTAAYRQPPARELLGAYLQEVEASPTQAGDHELPRAPGVATESLAKTKVEAPAPRPLQGTLPLVARASPVGQAGHAPTPGSGLTTSKPVSSPAPVSPHASPRAARRPLVALLLGAALVIGLGIGVAVMLAGRGRASANATSAPPPAVTTLPSASTSASGSATAAP
jgi:eukaryotic-like serine/threonine-protein kinase